MITGIRFYRRVRFTVKWGGARCAAGGFFDKYGHFLSGPENGRKFQYLLRQSTEYRVEYS
ncbi:hypothetical protein J2Z22_001003 [Paenibacillus forsythiae]|uniref:Uncharacterized protein n=1 Tax=Paenibacillus forsythiae TaxID=365616 RepID=A0ABU3H3U2_9BACL|nr:hypothetical protein [Paenibacillus forsythiae]